MVRKRVLAYLLIVLMNTENLTNVECFDDKQHAYLNKKQFSEIWKLLKSTPEEVPVENTETLDYIPPTIPPTASSTITPAASSTITPFKYYALFLNSKFTIIAFPSLGIVVMICNILFFATFLVQRTLMGNEGNVYLACTGLSDMMVSLSVMPVVFLNNMFQDYATDPLCTFIPFIVSISTYCNSIYFALASLEIFFRLTRISNRFNHLRKLYESHIVMGSAIICLIVSILEYVYSLNDDYCYRSRNDNIEFRFTATVILHVLPFVSGSCMILVGLMVPCFRPSSIKAKLKRSDEYDEDIALAVTSLFAYIIYAAFWTPYLILSLYIPDASDYHYYFTAWLGVLRIAITYVYYPFINKAFRKGYRMSLRCILCRDFLQHEERQRRNQQQEEIEHYELSDVTSSPLPPCRHDPAHRDTQTITLAEQIATREPTPKHRRKMRDKVIVHKEVLI